MGTAPLEDPGWLMGEKVGSPFQHRGHVAFGNSPLLDLKIFIESICHHLGEYNRSGSSSANSTRSRIAGFKASCKANG